MLHNFFITAFRNLWKYKGFSVINVLGLRLLLPVYGSFTTMCNFIILMKMLFLIEMNSFCGRTASRRRPGLVLYPYSHTPALLESYPEVVEGSRMEVTYDGFTLGENRFSERGMFVDSSFFSVFCDPFHSWQSRYLSETKRPGCADSVAGREIFPKRKSPQPGTAGRAMKTKLSRELLKTFQTTPTSMEIFCFLTKSAWRTTQRVIPP